MYVCKQALIVSWNYSAIIKAILATIFASVSFAIVQNWHVVHCVLFSNTVSNCLCR
jgi:hypothetical protein